MLKIEVMGGSVSLIREGDQGKNGKSKKDVLIVNGGMSPVFVDRMVWRAITTAMRENEEVSKVVAGWLK